MTWRTATTGSAVHMVGTGLATRCPKLARNRPATATGTTWRAACDAAVEWRCTGCSCDVSKGFPETDGALDGRTADEEADGVGDDDMVTGSTRGIVAGGHTAGQCSRLEGRYSAAQRTVQYVRPQGQGAGHTTMSAY